MSDVVDPVRTEVKERFAAMPDRLTLAARAAADRSVPAGEWGPREIVRHLIAVDREVWWTRFASILTEDEPMWGWMEPGLEAGLEDASLEAVLARFREVRAQSAAILDRFDVAAWTRTGVHATFGRLDAVGLLGIVDDHDAEHLASLSADRAS